MNQPPTAVLACDFSADRLDVALHAPDGSWPFHHRAYENNWVGFQAMKQDVLSWLARDENVTRLVAVGESTGLYWWHAFYHITTDPDLAPYQPQLALLNPLHVKHFRQALPQRDKDDPADAWLIDHFFQVNGGEPFYHFNERYLPLRQFTRAYCRLVHTLAAEKAFCLTLVYLLASDYQRQQPFSDVFGVTSQHVLREYPDIAAIAAIPTDALAQSLRQVTQGRLPTPTENATRLQQAAATSYPLAASLRPAVHATLTHTLDHIRFLEQQQLTYRQSILAALDALPEALPLQQMAGFGPILTAGLLAEIQDTRRFITGEKYDRRRQVRRPREYRDGQASVARMAGLWWPKNSSGRFVGEERHLARERNPYLRYWLVQAAYSLKGHQDEYAHYYWQKFSEVKKHQHKRALILTARKAVRLVFALLHKGQMAQLEESAPA